MTTPKDILIALSQAILNGLALDESQVEPSIQRPVGPQVTWEQNPYIVILPGSIQPEGGGQGAQHGGSLIRTMFPQIIIYTKNHDDQFGESEIAMLGENSILDYAEQLITLFRETFLGQNPYSTLNGLLIEPIFFLSQSAPEWENYDQRMLRLEITLSTTWASGQTTSVTDTVATPQYLNG